MTLMSARPAPTTARGSTRPSGFWANARGFHRPEAGFFLWLDVDDGVPAARRLWAEAAVKAMPGAFLAHGKGGGNPGRRHLRLALVTDEAATEDALTRIAEVLPA